MILEIEYFKGDIRLTGKTTDISELKKQLDEAEALYDKETDNFTELFCRMFNWSVTGTEELPDVVYDRDTQHLYKPKY